MLATRSRTKLNPPQSSSITSPIGGLNARDSLAAMAPEDAVILDNFFPTPTTVDLRNGSVNWKTAFPAAVESLLPYTSAIVAKLFAASGTAFYDATTQGAIGAPVVTGLSNARWQSANMGTPGGQFMLNVNGTDKLRGYDGTNWWADGDGSHDITGVNTANCIHINVFKNRVWLVEKNTFHAWYLPLQSVSGAAQLFDLSSLFKLGGFLMAMATWTIDNAAGVNEYAVFISSEGEIAFYEGIDPSTAATWILDGMFRVGRPVGRRCFTKVGADVIVITSDGAFPLSKALLTDRSQLQDAITAKIIKLINADIQAYNANFGWEITLFPLGNKLIINVPQTPGVTQYQYVMNTITGAWCRFLDWNANCFCVLQDVLYYGGNLTTPNSGFVAKADLGNSDNGNFIFGEVQTAFQYFGAPGRLKRWTMARPVFLTAGAIGPSIRMDVDFETVTPTSTGTFSATGGTPWDTDLWDTFPWGSNTSIKKNWQAVGGNGYAGALHMKLKNNATSLSWMSVDYVFEYGQIL